MGRKGSDSTSMRNWRLPDQSLSDCLEKDSESQEKEYSRFIEENLAGLVLLVLPQSSRPLNLH